MQVCIYGHMVPQEYLQRSGAPLPNYRQHGSESQRTQEFVMTVLHNGIVYGKGRARQKKAAEAEAAIMGLANLLAYRDAPPTQVYAKKPEDDVKTIQQKNQGSPPSPRTRVWTNDDQESEESISSDSDQRDNSGQHVANGTEPLDRAALSHNDIRRQSNTERDDNDGDQHPLLTLEQVINNYPRTLPNDIQTRMTTGEETRCYSSSGHGLPSYEDTRMARRKQKERQDGNLMLERLIRVHERMAEQLQQLNQQTRHLIQWYRSLNSQEEDDQIQ